MANSVFDNIEYITVESKTMNAMVSKYFKVLSDIGLTEF